MTDGSPTDRPAAQLAGAGRRTRRRRRYRRLDAPAESRLPWTNLGPEAASKVIASLGAQGVLPTRADVRPWALAFAVSRAIGCALGSLVRATQVITVLAVAGVSLRGFPSSADASIALSWLSAVLALLGGVVLARPLLTPGERVRTHRVYVRRAPTGPWWIVPESLQHLAWAVGGVGLLVEAFILQAVALTMTVAARGQ